jgi:tRNA-(guanine-N1)-methyltransferase
MCIRDSSESALNDSLMDGETIEAPYYTRPAEYKGMKVPEILLSGHDKKLKSGKKSNQKF